MSNMIESLAQDRHAKGRLRSTRTRAGWLLVGLGLRLALPGRQDAARRITLIGR
jgi:hypothetical protein